ncbi:MAG: hypothetical protein Q8Q48_02160 [Candidatus Staskawiczbacteria bacterium]|nr:hypothetical protein [Candidatus Staskawiczbacteria bacterium]
MSKLSFLNKLDKNTALAGVAVIGIVVVAFLVFANNNGGAGAFNVSGLFGQSNDKTAQAAVDYINNNGLSSTPATLVSVTEESGLVKVKIDIGGNQFDSYITKDGKYLFPQAIDISGADTADSGEEQDTSSSAQGSGPKTVDEIQKTDNPMLNAYVVSRCPYGLQMQRAIAEAVKTAPALAEYVNIRYIGSVSGDGKTITAMHGDAEAQENLRQICVREEQPAKYWAYVSCQMEAGDTAGCEKSTGVDSAKLNTCISNPSQGVAYAKEDFDLNAQFNVTGSPTLILGDTGISEFNFGGRSADAVRTMVCGAFNSEPSFCSNEFNTSDAATSFSVTYAGSGTASGNSGTTGTNCAPAQ